MASIFSFDEWNVNGLTREEEDMISALIQRDLEPRTSFFILEEIVSHRLELMRHLVKPGIVEKFRDFLDDNEVIDDNQSLQILEALLRKIICLAPADSACFNVDSSTIDDLVSKLTDARTCQMAVRLLAKVTLNSNAQIFAARAGVVDLLVPLLSLDALSCVRDAMLELLANVAKHPHNAIWFRTCIGLTAKLHPLLNGRSQSVRLRAARLLVCITMHKSGFEPDVAIASANLLVMAVRNAPEPREHDQLVLALSNLREVPEYCSWIDRQLAGVEA